MFHVTRCLHEYGHQVILAALNTTRHYQNKDMMQGFATVYDCPIQTDLNPWKALRAFLFEEIPYNILRFRSAEFRDLLEKIVQKENPDIIQMEGVYLAMYAKNIQKISGAPLLLRAHNVEFEIWERLAAAETNFLKAFYLRHLAEKGKVFEQQAIQLFDGIVAITERDAQQFRSFGYQGKMAVVPAGVDWAVYQVPTVSVIPLSVCFLGSLEWMPNQQGLLWFLQNVWEKIRAKVPEAVFRVAGKNPPEKILKWQQAGVEILGQVKDAPEFLASNQIMVVPLLAGGGMRLKIMEGMAAGLPVISTPVGAEGIDSPLIDLHENPDSFAEAVIAYLQNPEALRQRREAVRQAAKAFDWDIINLDLVQFYQTCLS